MISIWCSDNELEQFKTVKNKELNELLAEVRLLDDRYFLQENVHVQRKGFKKVEYTKYTLLFRYNEIECQIVNFPQDAGSINTVVTASYIFTYLLGLLTGLNHK